MIYPISINLTDNYNLTTNFHSSEIIGASHFPDSETSIVFDFAVVDVAQYIRNAIARPVTINSAFRNLDYNKSIGSNDSSQHPKGTALDLSAVGIVDFMETARNENNHHWKRMVELGLRGLGLYDWGVHIDTRSQNNVSFWDDRKKKVAI